jgi:hypothetical protein
MSGSPGLQRDFVSAKAYSVVLCINAPTTDLAARGSDREAVTGGNLESKPLISCDFLDAGIAKFRPR